MAATSDLPIVLYHYSYSPFARRLVWYLQLRKIPYVQCVQPPILPRPDVARLGIAYRRIPILSIGRDVYLDTRLIIEKLEAMFPSVPRLGAADSDPEAKAIERLLESFVIDGGLFVHSGRLLPPTLPLLQDPKFNRDRADFTGVKMTRATADALRPESLNEIRRAMQMLETTLLADGREWLLKTAAPSLADLEAVWSINWLINLPGAMPADQAKLFPKVYAWSDRFDKAARAAAKAQGKAPVVSGEEAHKTILASAYHEEAPGVDTAEAVVEFHGLRKGDAVQVWPLDSGAGHRDTGDLVGLTASEIVIQTKAGGQDVVRVHAPRHGFRVRPATEGKPNL